MQPTRCTLTLLAVVATLLVALASAAEANPNPNPNLNGGLRGGDGANNNHHHGARAFWKNLKRSVGNNNNKRAAVVPVCACCGGFECTVQSCAQSGSNVDAVMRFTLAQDFKCGGKQLREQINGVIKVTNWLDVTGNNNLGRRRVDECASAGTVLPAGSTITVQVAPTTAYGSGTGVYTLFATAEDEASAQIACGQGSF